MSFCTFRILVAFMILAAPALAQDYYQLPPVGGSTQPLRPLVPNYQYQLPSVPTYQMQVLPVPQYQPTPQRHWRDMVDDINQRFTSPAEIGRQFESMDQSDSRRIYGRCAKYNIHCANMLRSLGGN